MAGMTNFPQIAFFSLAADAARANADQVGSHIYSDSEIVLALADGVGKSTGGVEASKIAIRVALNYRLDESIESVFNRANEKILKNNLENYLNDGSTTLSFCAVRGSSVSLGHVGDSRVYHLRGNGLLSKTQDQTEVQALINEGILTRERALRYPRRNVLISALGSTAPFTLQTSEFSVESRDRVLLLSDGVYRLIARREIAELSSANEKLDIFLDKLKTILQNRGLIDDTSALCWHMH